MLTTEEKYALADKFLLSLRERDWAAMRSLMTEDAIWTMPGESLISGEAQGVNAVIALAQKIVSYGLNFRLKEILIGREGVALSLNNTAQRGDLKLDEQLATVFSLRDGKICRIDSYLSDIATMNAFFV